MGIKKKKIVNVFGADNMDKDEREANNQIWKIVIPCITDGIEKEEWYRVSLDSWIKKNDDSYDAHTFTLTTIKVNDLTTEVKIPGKGEKNAGKENNKEAKCEGTDKGCGCTRKKREKPDCCN